MMTSNPIRALALANIAGIGLRSVVLLALSSAHAQDLVLTPPPEIWIECGAATDPNNTGSAVADTPCVGGPNITFADSDSTGACPIVHIITRTWTATDACGNFANADQLIYIEDTESPVLSVPPDVYVQCGQSTDPSDTGNAIADDVCAIPTVTWSDIVSGSCPGQITRTWTAEDACGLQANDDQIITISTDTDGDGVSDDQDNCTLVANADQRDTNGDGIGNICDADVSIPNDCIVNFLDLQALRDAFLSAPGSPNWNPDIDFNGDSFVNFLDLLIMKNQFFGPPGPSSAGCN